MSGSIVTHKSLSLLDDQAQIDLALRRLRRFVRLEREYTVNLNAAGLRLLRAGTFSAYCDCRALGLGSRADAVLADVPPPQPAFSVTPLGQAVLGSCPPV